MGLAWRVAEMDLAVSSIDLWGHGNNLMLLDDQALDDVEATISQVRAHGKVVPIGQSLGGRLSLADSVDYAVGISPPTERTESRSTHNKLEKLWSYRVEPNNPEVGFDALERIPCGRLKRRTRSSSTALGPFPRS